MNSRREILTPTLRSPEPRPGAKNRRPDFAAACRNLLEVAGALNLDLEDLIDALRHHAAPTDHSN